jgi:hypothetical protein
MPSGKPPSVTLPQEEIVALLHKQLEHALANDLLLTQKQLARTVAEDLIEAGYGIQENRGLNEVASFLRRLLANSAESGISAELGRYAYCYLRDDAEKFHDLAKTLHPATQSNAFRFVDSFESNLPEQYISAHFGLWLGLQGYEVVLEQHRKQGGRLTNPDVAAWTSSDLDFLVLLDAKDTDTDWAKEITSCCGYKRFANLSYIGFPLDAIAARDIEAHFGPWACWDQTTDMCELARASGVGVVFLEYERLPRDEMLEWHSFLETELSNGAEPRKVATMKRAKGRAWINCFRVHKVVDAERDYPAPSVIRRYLDARGWLSEE